MIKNASILIFLKLIRTIILIVLLIVLLLSTNSVCYNSNYNVLFKKESAIKIKGKTNVNEFTCDYNGIDVTDTLHFTVQKTQNYIDLKMCEIVLKTEKFDCHKHLINKDFYSLLSAKQYPTISLHFVRAELLPNNRVKAIVNIRVKNKTIQNTIEVHYKVLGKHLFLESQIPLNIENFGIQQPKKMLGVIKVNNKIEIRTKLILEILS